MIKAPVWSREIPWYFFAGGVAGASAAQALAADATGNRELARRAWLVALAGVAVSPPLLISDLGRPERFFNMLRVFKVTSPMSVGSWVLGAMGTATAAAGATEVLEGVFPRAGAAAKVAAGVLGLPLATYTAVLLANSARSGMARGAPGAALPVRGRGCGDGGCCGNRHHAAGERRPSPAAGGAGGGDGGDGDVDDGAPPRGAGKALSGRRERALRASVQDVDGDGRDGGRGRPSQSRSGAGRGDDAAGRQRRHPLGGFKAGFASAADPAYTVGPQRTRISA